MSVQPDPSLAPVGVRLLRRPILALLLGSLVVVAFVPILHQPFIAYDDLRSVGELEFVEQGLTPAGIWAALRTEYMGNWIPATLLSHMLDFELWGGRPAGHYLVNLLLHLATSVLLFLFLDRTTGQRWPAFLAAGLWALHPLRVESVAWIAERKDVLSGCLAAAVLLAYPLWVRRRDLMSYLTVSVLLALGLLAKPMLVTMPVLLLLIDVWPLRRLQIDRWSTVDRRQALRCVVEKVPWLGLSLLASAAALYLQGRPGTWHSVSSSLPLDWRLKNVIVGVAAYVERTFVPRELAVFYPLAPEPPPLPTVLTAAGFLLALTVAAIAGFRRHPYLAVGWSWFLISLLPVCGLVQVGRQASADRYTYLPSWGLAVAITWWGSSLVSGRSSRYRRLAVSAVLALLFMTLGLLTRLQLRFWQSDEALFGRVVAVTPPNEVGHAGLGRALIAKGEIEAGTDHLVRALRIAPGRVRLYGEVAQGMMLLGMLEEAEPVLRKGIEVSGGDARISRLLATLLLHTDRPEEAAELLAPLVRRYPDDQELRAELANALARLAAADAEGAL